MFKVNNIRNFIRKARKYGLFIPLSNILLVYGKYVIPHRLLQSIAQHRDNSIENKIKSISKTRITNYSESNIVNNEPIWLFWMQGEENMPSVAKLCLEYLRKNANSHPVIVITKDNIKNYVTIPNRVYNLWGKGNITTTHFSDILRLALLSQHGGFWADATMLITRPIPEEIFNSSLFTIKTQPFGYYVSKCRWTGFCIASREKGMLVTNAYQMLIDYWNNTDIQIDYFILDYIFDILYKENEIIQEDIDKIPYTNENLHQINPILCDNYDEKLFAELTKDTYMFKLSWKTYSTEQLTKNPNNYYNHLLNKV